eukprot:TRINITY_DN9005_c0_g1_i1.p1 TRINITY_DN9005_c0_g1~~TRINITY_DN9005_c0_g1_i1.p1  ORF type:complete len:425 (+),score=152.42 TRINITY_DN9005_c0_g1_i1:149-1423(+)
MPNSPPAAPAEKTGDEIKAASSMQDLPEVNTKLKAEEEKVLLKAIAEGRVTARGKDGAIQFVTLNSGIAKNDVSVGAAADIAVRRWREKATLQAEIEELQDQRHHLEEQISELKKPVKQEVQKVRQLQRRVIDVQASTQATRSRNMDAKEVREAELAKLKAQVNDLEAVVAHERELRKANEDRYAARRAERDKLRSEIAEEKAKQDTAAHKLRIAKEDLKKARDEQEALKREAKQVEDRTKEIAHRCYDLRKHKAHVGDAVLTLKSELHKVKMELTDGQKTLQNKGDHSKLSQEYEEKLKIWNALEAPAKLKEDVDFLTRENDNLRKNYTKAKHEREALAAAEKMLRDAIHRASLTHKALSAENAALQRAVHTLTSDATALLSEEAKWSSDEDSDADDAGVDEAMYAPVNPRHLQSLQHALDAS